MILILVLIFFGSKSIPGLARTAGKTIRQVREASADIQNEIRKSGDEMKKDLNLKEMIQETAEDIKRPLDQYAADIDNAVKYQPPKRVTTQKPLGHDPKPVATSEAPKETPAPKEQAPSKSPDKEDEA